MVEIPELLSGRPARWDAAACITSKCLFEMVWFRYAVPVVGGAPPWGTFSLLPKIRVQNQLTITCWYAGSKRQDVAHRFLSFLRLFYDWDYFYMT
jgi:hypothetical protein